MAVVLINVSAVQAFSKLAGAIQCLSVSLSSFAATQQQQLLVT